MISYSVRPHLFSGDVDFRLEGGALRLLKTGKPERQYPLATLKRAWVQNVPSQQMANLQKLSLRFESGGVSIVSHGLLGIGDFVDQHDSYDPFIEDLLAQAGRVAPHAVFRKGYGALTIGVAGLVIVLTPWLAIMTVLLLCVGEWGAAASVGFPTLMFGRLAWSFWQAMRRNWPGRFDPLALAGAPY